MWSDNPFLLPRAFSPLFCRDYGNSWIYSFHFVLSFLKYLFIYLAEQGLSCGIFDLCCGMQDLLVAACKLLFAAVGSSSLTRDWTGPPCMGSEVLASGPPGKSLILSICSIFSVFFPPFELIFFPSVFQPVLIWKLQIPLQLCNWL